MLREALAESLHLRDAAVLDAGAVGELAELVLAVHVVDEVVAELLDRHIGVRHVLGDLGEVRGDHRLAGGEALECAENTRTTAAQGRFARQSPKQVDSQLGARRRGAQKILAPTAAMPSVASRNFSLHSKRVFSLCSARRTRATALKADLLGKHPSKWDSRSSLGARQVRTQTSKLHTENNITFACLAGGTKTPLPSKRYQKHTFPKDRELVSAPTKRPRAATDTTRKLYRATRLDTCMRLARCAHVHTEYLKIDFFFRSAAISLSMGRLT